MNGWPSAPKYTTSQPASGQKRYSEVQRRRRAPSVNSALTVSRSTADPAEPLAGQRLAVERNGEIVPRSTFGDTRLADGDRIEVVMAVGGGE